jgi:hypothetical protein
VVVEIIEPFYNLSTGKLNFAKGVNIELLEHDQNNFRVEILVFVTKEE